MGDMNESRGPYKSVTRMMTAEERRAWFIEQGRIAWKAGRKGRNPESQYVNGGHFPCDYQHKAGCGEAEMEPRVEFYRCGSLTRGSEWG